MSPATTQQRAERSPEQRAIAAKLERFAAKYRKAAAGLAALEDERTALYLEARAAGVTFRDIAAAFGVTEAAVMQKIKRAAPEAS